MNRRIFKTDENGTGAGNGDEGFWKRWYIIVFVFLVLQIILYYFITQYFKH
jgi:hypothetical protein